MSTEKNNTTLAIAIPTAEELAKMHTTRRKDVHLVDPRRIVPDYNFNVRKNYGSDEIREQTKASIRANGVIDALHVYKARGEEYYFLTDGFRRLELVNELISEGVEIFNVPVIFTSNSLEERYVDMFVTGTTKLPLEEIESAEVVRNLSQLGWDRKQLSFRLGIPANRITYLLKIATLPQQIKTQISESKISPLVAVQISDTIDNDYDKVKAVTEAIANAEAENKQSGGKSAKKATARHAKVLKKASALENAKAALEAMDKKANPRRYAYTKKVLDLLENKASEAEFTELFNQAKG